MITPRPRAFHTAASRPAPLLASLAGLVLLAACSATPVQVAGGTAATPAATQAAATDVATDPWASNCYAGFKRDVLRIAGPEAVNCGLLRIDATEEQRAQVEDCTRAAEASKRPYRSGQIGIDIADTYIACDVAIRDPSGQRWRLWYDFDLQDRLSQGRSDGVVAVSRCSSILFRPGTLLSNSFFELDGCREAPMVVASPISTAAVSPGAVAR